MSNELFKSVIDKGATLSFCRCYRYALWRIWDINLPMVMYIGLNPSTANEATNDATIESWIRISKNNGYGGFYMMNCFPFITTDPKYLKYGFNKFHEDQNNYHLISTGKIVKDVIFAWGNFKEPIEYGMKRQLEEMFPNAKCISKNKNGSPGHPLYKKASTIFIPYY